MKIANNNESVILNNCKNNVINIICKNKILTENNSVRKYLAKFRFSKYHFVVLWMTNYENGLGAVAAAINRPEWHAWQKYCEFVANGVKLPKPAGYNPYEFGSNEVSQLNRTVKKLS